MTLRDASLSTDVQLRNAGDEPLEFTAALHTYLATHRRMLRERVPRLGGATALCPGLPLVGLTGFASQAPGHATHSARAAVPPQGPTEACGAAVTGRAERPIPAAFPRPGLA